MELKIDPKMTPALDPEFVPAVLWNRAYRKAVEVSGEGEPLIVALERGNGAVSAYKTAILPHSGENVDLNVKYVERLIKFLLWAKGGCKITVGGNPEIAKAIAEIYSAEGVRKFDHKIMGERIYGKCMEVAGCAISEAPESKEQRVKVGGNWDGCRVGFDLGGSDRKCAAVIDGEVVFTEEVGWNPYFEKDPEFHRKGIIDSIRKAAEKLPRVDAIGGSSAGVYVDNKVRIASLFRGVSDQDFKDKVENLFLDIRKEWNNVPLVVANDGDVTALQGAMSMKANGVLGIAMGTSQAVGYVTPEGSIADWLNELAFAPVDYRENGPVDEWSGDEGCGVQYFSQQAVARLVPAAGLDFGKDVPLPEQLVEVQKLMDQGDERARKIYESIGVYFGYSVAHYAEHYQISNLLILGRVTSGPGGEIIINTAEEVLKEEFPELAGEINFCTPDEKMKRHGQAVTAASLPSLEK